MVFGLTVVHPLKSWRGDDVYIPKQNQTDEEKLFVNIPKGIAESELWDEQEEQKSDDLFCQVMLIQKPSSLKHGWGCGWDLICDKSVGVHFFAKLAKLSTYQTKLLTKL
jgi:hypothetical protein